MRARGFEVLDFERPSSAIQDDVSIRVFGGVSASFLALFEAPQSEPAAPTGTDNPARQAALSDCYGEARNLADPLEPYRNWLQENLGDINARVASDRRVQQAHRDSAQCFLNLGYGLDNEADLTNSFSDRANKLYEDYAAGRLSRQEGLGLLEAVAAEEESISAAVSTCIYQRQIIELSVLSQFQQEFLDEHGSALREVLQELIPEVRKYEPSD